MSDHVSLIFYHGNRTCQKILSGAGEGSKGEAGQVPVKNEEK
jgi:hypothetical protein